MRYISDWLATQEISVFLLRTLSTRTKPNFWWNQFPSALRIVSQVRFLASIGAGGVIYLTPLIFNQLELSATQIGSGIAAAAFSGALSRLFTGGLLDRGANSSLIIKSAALFAVFADFLLLTAQDYGAFALGQIFLGTAAGFYWPAVELSVPSSCGEFPSSKGFALVRSADALGTSVGAILGSCAALIGMIRIVYLLDTMCMISLIVLLTKRPLKDKRADLINRLRDTQLAKKDLNLKEEKSYLSNIIPILIISLLATAIFSLLQSALPLDLVRGGISRPPLSEGWSGSILAFQLGLLVIFQWPIGRWLSFHKQSFGLAISIANFGVGCLILSISTLWSKGIIFALLSQIPLAIGLAAFLPTATESIIQNSPIQHRGIAMALFSQCFAISALIAPIFAGIIIDTKGNGMLIWLIMSICCFIILPLTTQIKSKRTHSSEKALPS